MDYLLRKNEHKCSPRTPRIYAFTKKFEWNITFSTECWYERDQVEFTGYNKLRGIAFGTHNEDIFGKCKLTKWMVNSVSIAWQPVFNDPNKQKIDLILYYDVNGVEYREPFTTVNINENFNVRFNIKNGVYVKINDGEPYYVPTKTWLKLGYHLWPYFGGKSTSPHDMIVTVDEI